MKLEPNIEDWLQKFPRALAEAGGMELALHRPPVYIEIKAGADPVKVCEYPMPLEYPTYRSC